MLPRSFGNASVAAQTLWVALFLCAPKTGSADFFAKVIGVQDGDTIEVMHIGKSERIRLNGIDCPEKGQAYGTRAKQAASALVFGKEVTLQTYGKDRYQRTLAEVFLPDPINMNHELIKSGRGEFGKEDIDASHYNEWSPPMAHQGCGSMRRTGSGPRSRHGIVRRSWNSTIGTIRSGWKSDFRKTTQSVSGCVTSRASSALRWATWNRTLASRI